MRLKRYFLLFSMLFGFIFKMDGQDISLYNQYNGRFDFTFIGNTLNEFPNGTGADCVTLTSSSATLSLAPDDIIESAYLYWAGSGSGDFEVKLNGIDISAARRFAAVQNSTGNPFFSAFADVTTQLQTTGNGDYTLSELDVNPFFDDEHYCNNGTNFAGWAIVIVYRNDNLPLNQVNVYDGLETLSALFVGTPVSLDINLGNLNVLDNSGAKLGFVSWEGDETIANEESLWINDHRLSDPFNPEDNIFNGTNNIIGRADLYNMDLDIYDIQEYISVGNTSAHISMTTAQDYVMINVFVTKLNSQLPDATVAVDSIEQECDSRVITVNYTVSNLNSTDPLPSGTPISIYADGVRIAFDETILPIDIGGSTDFHLTMVIPDSVPVNFTLTIVVDDTGNGTGIVNELNETNNSTTASVSFWLSPTFNSVEALQTCNEGLTRGTFDFSSYEDLARTNPNDMIRFYETPEDAAADVSAILNPTNYVAATTPKVIYARISNEHCFTTTSFLLTTRNCPPTVYNYLSLNNDTYNEDFFIAGLRDIFLNFELQVYNRWGQLVWTGNNYTENWKGYIGKGVGGKYAPDGTYFYLLFLNDVDYPQPLKGFLYLNH